MEIEKLMNDLEETEITIKELHDTANKLEEIRDKLPIGIARERTEVFIQELNKEIEWNEEIKQEIKDGINFEIMRN